MPDDKKTNAPRRPINPKGASRRLPARKHGKPLAQELWSEPRLESDLPAFDPALHTPVFLATRNPGKVTELRAMLEHTLFWVLGPGLIDNFSPAVEDGATFEANATKKAYHYSRRVPHLVLADDSGLEVDALGGEPGVRSARVGGAAASDADRNRLVLSKMENVAWEERKARFRCSIAIAQNGEILATFDGSVEGLISFEPEGSAGFGYDPVFYYPPMDMTFAEMTAEEKDRISHRGQALDKARAWLEELAILSS